MTKYISRSKAIRKLQVSLRDFRRLCILKGVYPREPPLKLRKSNKVYYHVKDINFLSAEKLITKFREEKIFLRKFKRAKETNNIGQVKYLAKHRPQYSLNHLIRERYPEFVDALRDLDDPLSTIALFSIFPSHKEFSLERKEVDNCITLMRQWNKYVIETRSLRKAFLSIKGIYYQVEVMGQPVTYVIPYEYPPNMPIDVDYRVMLTFLEFYETLMKFVLLKVYSLAGKKYPPAIPAETDLAYFNYDNFRLEDLPRSLDQDDNKYEIDEKFRKEISAPSKAVFDGLVFFLNSEVPRYSLEFVIRAAGGEVYWEGLDAGVNIDSVVVTHVVTDRDNINKKKTKEYIQPQWVYDSLNNQILLDVKEYEVGKVDPLPLRSCPPHLSPFVSTDDEERHVPQREQEIQRMKGKAVAEKHQAEEDSMEEEDVVYDIVEEQKEKAKKKKREQKEMTAMAKGIMTSKNRGLFKAIEMSKAKDKRENERLASKTSSFKGRRK